MALLSMVTLTLVVLAAVWPLSWETLQEAPEIQSHIPLECTQDGKQEYLGENRPVWRGNTNYKYIVHTDASSRNGTLSLYEMPILEDDMLAELDLDNSDNMFHLLSNIEAAFRFLEAETIDQDLKLKILENVGRQIAPLKVKKLPFLRHNFIRFGKRDV